MGAYGTVRVEYVDGEPWNPEVELGPKGSFLWFLRNKVVNQRVNLPQGHREQGYILSQSGSVVDENSRANPSTAEITSKSLRRRLRLRCWVHWTSPSSQLHTQPRSRLDS